MTALSRLELVIRSSMLDYGEPELYSTSYLLLYEQNFPYLFLGIHYQGWDPRCKVIGFLHGTGDVKNGFIHQKDIGRFVSRILLNPRTLNLLLLRRTDEERNPGSSTTRS